MALITAVQVKMSNGRRCSSRVPRSELSKKSAKNGVVEVPCRIGLGPAGATQTWLIKKELAVSTSAWQVKPKLGFGR